MIQRVFFVIVCIMALLGGFVFSAGAVVHIRVPLEIPVRDVRPEPHGQTFLTADAYLPAETGAWPVILIQTPYNKDLYAAIFLYEISQDPLLKSPDYAFVVADWRGFFDNVHDLYAGCPTHGEDGYDMVEWVAEQTWCTGRIGTWGLSALGHVQFLTAAEQPPHLVCAVPMVAHYGTRYEDYYPGGVYYRNKNDFIESYYGSTSLVKAHPLYDTVWQAAESLTGDPAVINVPMLHISGWYDHQTRTSMREMQAIHTLGGPLAKGYQKMFIGPWAHGSIDELTQGQLEYPLAQYKSSEAALAFFDFYLRSISNGYDTRPTYRYYRLGEERWVDSTSFPSSNVRTMDYFFHPDHTLVREKPGSSSSIAYWADPSNPVPTIFGAVLTETYGQQGTGDLRSVEARSDVLTFTTAPQKTAMRIEGTVQAQVWVQSDCIDTDIAVRMMQVYPDGRSMLLIDGIHRASLRDSFSQKQLLTPGMVYKVQVTLPPVSATIPASHALRISVGPSNFDRFDKNMQDGSSLSDDIGASTVSGNVTVLLGGDHASCITLPLAPNPASALPPVLIPLLLDPSPG